MWQPLLLLPHYAGHLFAAVGHSPLANIARYLWLFCALCIDALHIQYKNIIDTHCSVWQTHVRPVYLPDCRCGCLSMIIVLQSSSNVTHTSDPSALIDCSHILFFPITIFSIRRMNFTIAQALHLGRVVKIDWVRNFLLPKKIFSLLRYITPDLQRKYTAYTWRWFIPSNSLEK